MSDESTALTPFEGIDMSVWEGEDHVANVGESAVDVVFSGSRLPSCSLLTTNSRIHSTHGFLPGTWVVGGTNPRPVTLAVGQKFIFVPAAIRNVRLRTNPADAAEEKGKVLCGALPQPDPTDKKKRIYTAAAPNGLFSPSGCTLKPKLEKVPGGKKGEEQYKVVGFELPDDAEATSSCNNCLYGPGRNPGAPNDRGFVDKKAVFNIDGAKDGIVMKEPVPDEFRKPSKLDCSLVIRMFGFVLCPEYNGMPAGWVACCLTFRNSGFKAATSAASLVQDWSVGVKQPWSHALQFTSEGVKNDRFSWQAPVCLGVLKAQVPDGKGGVKEGAWPVPGPKAAEAARAAGKRGVTDVQSLCLELKEQLEPRDWFGWIDDVEEGYGSAAEDDAAHMPTTEPPPY